MDEPLRPPDLPALDLDLVPRPLAELARSVAEVWGVDPALVAAPGLVVAGLAAGGGVCLQLPGGMPAWPLLWLGVVARTGRGKTPMSEHALRPIREREADLDERNARTLDDWRALPRKVREETPRPALRRLTVGDTTFERACMLLGENGQGLLWVRDELLGVFGQLSAYHHGESGNFREADLLSSWSRTTIRRDRVADNGDYVIVQQPFLPLVGGIQPGRVSRLGDNSAGLLSRLLVYWPSDRVPQLQDGHEISHSAEWAWRTAVDRLLELRARECDAGSLRDHDPVYHLHRTALEVWRGHLEERRRRLMNGLAGLEDELLSKVDQQAGRLIVTLQRVERPDQPYVSAEVVERGWRLAWTFHAHQLALYRAVAGDVLPVRERTMFDALNALDQLVRGAGGRLSRRDAQQQISPHRWRRRAEFSALVQEWVARGLGREDEVPTRSGPPSHVLEAVTDE